MKKLLALLAVLAFSQMAMAQQTADYGWEDTATLLGMYPDSVVIDDIATTPPGPVHTGSQSLELEKALSGTGQAYVAWIVGLSDGEEVTASFWCYDISDTGYPSGRIWAHWNDDPNDPQGYSGSAGGNSTYTSGIGWEQLEQSWIVESGHTGIVIEARFYGDPGTFLWFDDVSVTAPATAEIRFPGYVALQRSTWGSIKSVF